MGNTEVYHKSVACPACCCSQDLPAHLQQCECRCHPANWPTGASQRMHEILESLEVYFSRHYPLTNEVSGWSEIRALLASTRGKQNDQR